MGFRYLSKSLALSVSLLLLPAIMLGSTNVGQTSTSQSATGDVPEQASALLEQVQSRANRVSRLADHLTILDREPMLISWRDEAITLDEMRHQINTMDRTVARLRAVQPATLPWQRQAIDLASLRAAELTDTAQLAIHYLNHHQDYLANPGYVADATTLFDRSQDLAQALHNFEAYHRTRQEQRKLAHALGLKSTS